MNDQMNEIERFSPFGGQLIEELVKGSDNQLITAENTVITETGKDRTMFSYIPTSGCPDAKQCQVLMVLRDSGDQHGAEQLMKRLQLDKLAEDKHFILLFPNPETDGWNYQLDPQREDDVSFLVRCFTCLPKSKGTVAGFNGMIFYLGCSETSSAMLASLAAVSPINCAALMVEKFPSDYQLPVGDLEQVQDAWIYGDNRSYLDHLKKVNGIQFGKAIDDTEYFENSNNPNIRFFASKHELSVSEVWKAWDYLFSETRRWRNDTYGTYQKRTNFTERGFTAHVKDSSLGVNNGYEHTWYEYIPEQLRGTSQKVPLLFYFHGGNCIPLYGAEQSGYHDLADQEDFIVVYPRASTNKRWNCWDDSDAGVSDFQFILALIKHMKEIHPIDETRIYVSGFSMGSMMTNALCCAYPDVFAAGAALNAQNFGYFGNLTSTMCLTTKRIDTDETIMNKKSHCHELADFKKIKYDYRMPLIQFSGLLDTLATNGWPIDSSDNLWLKTIDYWKEYNHIPVVPFRQSVYETGLCGDVNDYEGTDERFIHHIWFSDDKKPYYQFVAAKRMPHAVDLREIKIAWNFLRQFRRCSDGTLISATEEQEKLV